MSKTLRSPLLWIGVVVGALWLVKYFSETEMRRLDKEVDRLCAIDGRSVIYETVKLPADKFHASGRVLIPTSGKDDTNFGYYVSLETTNLAGPGQAPGARLLRTVYRVVRSADNKVMAEHLFYTRSGGNWLEGAPGGANGKSCPGVVPSRFRERVFIKE
jgi:hypothetical protein